MIIYDLSCDNNHRFEGWFRSANDFEQQGESHLIRCPQCDSSNIRRIPSAVLIGGNLAEPSPQPDRPSNSAAAGTATAMIPVSTQLAAAYRSLVQAIVENSEDVGASFAEEARKIHYGETPERFIRGQATEDECDSLRDEGIQILHLPSIKDEELN